MLTHGRMYGLRVRQLESIGNLHTRRFGFIIARAWREAYRAIWAHLREERGQWDVLRLCQLPEGSQTLNEVRALAAGDGFLLGTCRSDDSPYVSLPGPSDTSVTALDSKPPSTLRNSLNPPS